MLTSTQPLGDLGVCLNITDRFCHITIFSYVPFEIVLLKNDTIYGTHKEYDFSGVLGDSSEILKSMPYY